MSDIFEDSDEVKVTILEDDLGDTEEVITDHRLKPMMTDARRRLEALIEEKRLKEELDDFLYD